MMRSEGIVTWAKLVPILGAFAAFMLLATAQIANSAKADTVKATQTIKEEMGALNRKVDQNKTETDAGMLVLKQEVSEGRKDTQAIYQYLLSKQRQPRLEKQ